MSLWQLVTAVHSLSLQCRPGVQGQLCGLSSSGHTGPQHCDTGHPEMTVSMCATVCRGYCPAHMHPGQAGAGGGGSALVCSVEAGGPPDPGSQAMGLHGGNRSWDSYGHWECLLSCVREKPLVGRGVTSQKSLVWEGPSASPAQDSGQSLLSSHSPACPEPGALPGKPQTARKSGQLDGRGCGPGRLLRAIWAGLWLTGRASFHPSQEAAPL